jgi:hypothetical protein
LTTLHEARYATLMNVRSQWVQGLQWGACAWLGYITTSGVVRAYHASSYGWHGPRLVVAAAWLVAFALCWTRWSRPAVATAMVVQMATSLADAAGYEGDMHAAWALTFWLPMSLPLLPLLFFRKPNRPRLTLALLAMGRWREAMAELSGWRWPLVAAGVVLLNRSAWRALQGQDWAVAFAPTALLFALAALPRLRSPATA